MDLKDYSNNLLIDNKNLSNYYHKSTDFDVLPIHNIYLSLYKKIPSKLRFNNQFKKEFIIDFLNKNKEKIIASNFFDDKIEWSFLNWGTDNEICIFMTKNYDDTDNYDVLLFFSTYNDSIRNFYQFFYENSYKEKQSHYLNILVVDKYNGYAFSEHEINSPKIDFSLNYNQDFESVHKIILNKLSDNSKGLVLLYGEPGTGKTTYIRFLINILNNKKIIYIPPNMVNSIAEPELIKFLLNHPNSILIIEDAENVLMKRSGYSSQAISNILNLTDGLLSDCLNIQVVATFNTNIFNIDEALLRKGRLIAKYEFKKLSEDRAINLAKKLNVDVEKKYTLAEIYNAKEESFTNDKNKIGF